MKLSERAGQAGFWRKGFINERRGRAQPHGDLVLAAVAKRVDGRAQISQGINYERSNYLSLPKTPIQACLSI